MKNDPPAHVRSVDRIARAKGIYNEVCSSDRFNLQRAIEAGKILIDIKENGEHGDLDKTGIPKTTRWEWMQLGKSSAPNLLDCGSIREALKLIECKDEPEQEVTPTPAVPYATNGQPAKPPKPPAAAPQEPAPEREPGDEGDYDDMASKIQAVLCEKCKRKGISCDACRVKVFNLQNPRSKPDEPAKPKPPAPTGPKNGAVAIDWKLFADQIKKCAAFVQQSFSFYDAENSPEAESCRAKLEEAFQFIRKQWELKSKQKAPGGMR